MVSRTPDDERASVLELVGVLLSSLSPPPTDAELDVAARRGESPQSDAEPAPVAAWERQPSESQVAFEAFRLYRDGAPRRSIREVAAELGKRRQLLERWSTRHRWVDRVDAFLRDEDRQHIELGFVRKREEAREVRSIVARRDAKERARREARRSKSARRMRPPGSHRFVPLASLDDPSHPAFRQQATSPTRNGPDVPQRAGSSERSDEATEGAWPPTDSSGRILPEYWYVPPGDRGR